MNRRDFLQGSSMLSAAAALGLMGGETAYALQTPAPVLMPPGTPAYQSDIPAQLPTIREAGGSRNLLAGCAVNTFALRRDPAYAELVKQQAGIVVAENAMKFGPLRPAPDKFNFDNADFLFTFAEANGMKVRGHNFVWHRQLPRWFASFVTPQNAQAVLVNHIQTVGTRYAGRVQSWDVVNEAVQVSDGMPGGLRNSPWYKLLGPGYIDLAYRTAHQADPSALLCYNDYDIESEAPDQAAKRAAVLALVRGMKQRGVPLDAVGIQSHIKAGGDHRYGAGLQQFMQELQAMGLKMMLTEMDVNDRALPSDPAVRDHAVADVYRNYLNLTLANPNVIALLTWGLTDKYTWLNGEDSRADKLPERALPFDADLHPKLAYVAEVEAIQHAPMRS
jgi:endo-1,4-beta-xylanase